MNRQRVTIYYVSGTRASYECELVELDDTGSFLMVQEEENVVTYLNTRNIVKYIVAKVPDAPGF
jgi:hypothetical protein